MVILAIQWKEADSRNQDLHKYVLNSQRNGPKTGGEDQAVQVLVPAADLGRSTPGVHEHYRHGI